MFLLLLGRALYVRLGVTFSSSGTFGIAWLFFGYLIVSLLLIIIVGAVSASYLVSSMINQRMRDIGIIKAAGSLPRRLFAYVLAEGMLVVVASCVVGTVSSFLAYAAWSWPNLDLTGAAGPVPEAGATILVFVPVAFFFLSYLAVRLRVGKIIKADSASVITGQMSGLDLNKLGKPVIVKRFGSAFGLATRNVSRDRDLNRTLVRSIACIFLSVVILTGALVSADTSRDYVQRAIPANILLVANASTYDQYTRIGAVFSSDQPAPPFNYTNQTIIISPQVASSFANLTGVLTVDARLVVMTTASGYIRAHLITNETSGNYNNVYVPQVDLGSTQALVVGINPTSTVGNWYTSDGFLKSADNQTTVVAGDSLVGGIVQMPFDLAQIGALGIRYEVKSALVDPLNGGRVMYAPIRSVQNALNVTGYNVLLLKTDNSQSSLNAVQQLASTSGLVVGSLNQVLNSDLSFLNSTWSFLFILPSVTLALTCAVLLSYLTTNFSRRFNDYLVVRILGARASYSLRIFLWEGWGLLAVCMLISVPLAWLVSIFFLVPEAKASVSDQILSLVIPVVALSAVSLASALIYSRRLRLMNVKDLRI